MAKKQKTSTAVAVHKPKPAAAPKSEALAFIEMIERAAGNKDVDVAKLKELLAIRNDEQDRIRKQQFSADMVATQDAMRPVQRDMTNPQTHSRFASLEAVDNALRPVYSRSGFAPSFNTEPSPDPDSVRVVCDLDHRSGASRRYQIDMPKPLKGAKGNEVMSTTHGTGAAVSYGRRYLLLMIFNIITTDEAVADGNAVGELLSKEQHEDLKQKIDDAKLPMDKFEMAFGKLDALPASRLQEALDRVTQFKVRGFKAAEKETAQ